VSGIALARIVEIADRLFPFDQAESWDNSGLQIGDPRNTINAIAFSLDPTPLTIRFAADNSCGLLITHHPLFPEPLRSITSETLTGRTVLDSARLGVAVLSLHTNLDAANGGLNDHLATSLGLAGISVPEPARCARIGDLAQSTGLWDFARRVADVFQTPNVRVIARDDAHVRKVFLASGSGMSYLPEALCFGADVMVTGDVRYHAAREAVEMGMPVIDAGHFGLEKAAVGLLHRKFQEEFLLLDLQVSCVPCTVEAEPYQVIL
jgi:dinuclear metal center YbgI/SA1388 family protein